MAQGTVDLRVVIMTPETYQRLAELFARGSELSLQERTTFLDECGESDPELQSELARLLALDDPDGLSAPDELGAASNGIAAFPETTCPTISGYKIGELLGEGGMGQVWCAVQQSTQREVALKVIHGIRFASSQTRARFEREVELSARLTHPNIARVYASGVAEGYAYYAMELVRGKSLDAYVGAANLTEVGKVDLMLEICRAVQHAHQRGVIHRDLKPSNILVTEDGRPVLVDFGLAKSIFHEQDEARLLTQGVILGTPAYMSPEQAAGQTSEVDTRSDVYSLGVMLYWLLTHRYPHDTSGDPASAVRRVATEEIIFPRSAQPTMDRGLASILVKALARDPSHRYSAAGELADDLQRHIDGEPVMAHAAGTLYLLRRILRRHRRFFGTAAVLLILLIGAVAAFVTMTNRHARLALDLAGKAERGRMAALAAERNARRMAYVHRLEVANSEIANYRFRRAATLLDECPSEFRGWEWNLLRNQASPRDTSFAAIGPFDDRVRCIAFAPDGQRLAIATGRSTTDDTANPLIAVCDSRSGDVLAELRGHADGIFAVAFTPDGKQILSGGRDKSLRRWDAQTGSLLETVTGPMPGGDSSTGPMLFAIRFSPDGHRLAFASHPHGLFLAELPDQLSWKEILSTARHVHQVPGEDDSIAFSPDGNRLAWSTRVWQGDVGHLFTVNAESGQIMAHRERPEGAPAYCIDYDPAGAELVTADRRETVTLYSNDLQRVVGTFTRNEGSVHRAYFTAGGTSVIGLVPGGAARIWSRLSRETEGVLYPAYGLVALEMAITADRKRVAIATGHPVVVRLWDLEDALADATCIARHAPKVRDVATSSNGRFIATCGDDGTVQLRCWPDRRLCWTAMGELPYATAVAFSPDARCVAIGWSVHPDVEPEPPYGRVTIVDTQTGEPLRPPLNVPGWVWDVRFDRSGQKLVIADGVTPVQLPQQSGSAHVVDWVTGEFLRSVRVDDPRCRSAALAPSGKVLIVASEQTLSSWDVPSGSLLAEDRSADGRNFVHIIKNGEQLITGKGMSIEIRDLETFDVLQVFHQRRDMSPSGVLSMVGDVAIHPSGRTLVSGSWNGTLTVWDVESRQPLLTTSAHPTGVHRLVFSHDGSTLFSAGHDGKVRFWEAK